MEYTSMGSRGKYTSENNLWSRPWSASQPSSRRGSEQSTKDGSNIPRTGVFSEDNTDVDKIGASIEVLRRDGELSMGAPPPLTAAFSGSVSNFTHQSSSNINQARRGSRRSIAEAPPGSIMDRTIDINGDEKQSAPTHQSTSNMNQVRRGSRRSIAEPPPGSIMDRTVDINGDEAQSASVAPSAGNLSQGSMLGGSLGSRSLRKQKSGEVHRSIPPGLSSINDVSSSAEELDSGANVGRKSSTSQRNPDIGNANSLPPKFTLKQSTNDVYRSTSPGLSSQQNMTASIDDTPANSNLDLQAPQQVGVGGKAKSPFASRSTLQKSTEAVRSRNELKPPPGLSSEQNLSGSTHAAPVKAPPGLSSTQNVSASANDAHGTSSLQTLQHKEKKAKSPYASRASFKTSTEVLASDQPARRESELRPPPGLSSVQGSSVNVEENPNTSGSASQSVLHGGGKLKSALASRSSIHKSSYQVHGNEPLADTEEFRAAQNPVDDSSAYVGYVPYAQLSRKDRDVRGVEKAAVNFGASKSMNLGPKNAGKSVGSITASPSKSAFDLHSKDSADKNGKATSSTQFSKSERKVRIEDTPEASASGHGGSATLGSAKEVSRSSTSGLSANKHAVDLGEKSSNAKSYGRLTNDRVEQREVKTSSPKEVQTSFASLPHAAKDTNEKASGASYNQLAGSTRVEGAKTFSPKEVQTSFASVVARNPSINYQTKETHGKASGASYNQLAGNNREPRTEETTKPSGAAKLQSSKADVSLTKPDPAETNQTMTALPYSAAPSSFVSAVLSSIKAKNKVAEQEAAKPTELISIDKPIKVEDKQKTAASNASLGSRTALGAKTTVPRYSENEVNRFSSNASATTSAANRSRVDDFVKNSRPNSRTASESSLYSGPSLKASQSSIASSAVDRRTDRDDVELHQWGKTVSIGGISSIGNSASYLVSGSRGSFRSEGSEISLSASERGSTNSLRKRYGSEEVSKTETKEDVAKAVEPALERSYAFALKWDPYTLRVKCEHKGEIRLAYLPIRKILDELDDSCMIIDTFEKLFSDSIHNPDVFDPSRHFLAFLDADGDWCTLGDTPEDCKVFVESSKFDPTKAASRVARLKSFDLSILEDLNRRESIDSANNDDEPPSIGASRRESQGSVKSSSSVGERSGGRKLMHGDSEDLQEGLSKDTVGSSLLSEIKSTAFAFPNDAFSLQQAVFMGWLVGAAPMAIAVRHSEFWMASGLQNEEYHREEPWYDYTIFALGMSMLVSFIGFVRASTLDKQRLGLTLSCVNAISFCSYLSIVAGLTPTISDIVNRPLEIVRYIDWAFTCPTLILIMAQLTQTEGNIRRAMIVNVVMIASRFFGSCLPWSYALPFSAASLGCFSFLISDLWRWWSAAVSRQNAAVPAHGRTKGSIRVESLILLQILSTASSVMYPIIWLLGISDVVSFEEGEVLYCVADVLAKVVFTLIAVSNCFEYSGFSTTGLESDKSVAKKASRRINTSTSLLNSGGKVQGEAL